MGYTIQAPRAHTHTHTHTHRAFSQQAPGACCEKAARLAWKHSARVHHVLGVLRTCHPPREKDLHTPSANPPQPKIFQGTIFDPDSPCENGYWTNQINSTRNDYNISNCFCWIHFLAGPQLEIICVNKYPVG